MGDTMMSVAIWQRLIKHWPWAQNAITRQWVDQTWTETDGDKQAIQSGLDACVWIDGMEW